MHGTGYAWDGAPSYILQHIETKGVSSRDGLVFLTERIQRTWSNSPVTSANWVASVAQAIELLYPLVLNKEKLDSYLDSTLPPGAFQNYVIAKRPAYIQKEMKNKADAGNWGDYTSRCLLLLLRDGIYESFNEKLVKNLSDSITPWGFLVGKRSYLDASEAGYPFIISRKLLANGKCLDEIPSDIFINKGNITLQGFVSDSVSFGLTFPNGVMLTLTGSDIFALVHCLDKRAQTQNLEIKAGHWEFYAGDRPSLQFKEIFIPLKDCVGHLMGIAVELRDNKMLMQYLCKDYVARYGAV